MQGTKKFKTKATGKVVRIAHLFAMLQMGGFLFKHYFPLDLGPPPLTLDAPPRTEAEAVLSPPLFEKVLP